jgi:hypothetical protein
MVIDDNTLLQTDATVIAGVLVLLTIYSLRQQPSDTTYQRIINIVVAVAIVTTIVPFSVSAILILSPDKDPAAGVAYGGFIYLIVGIILIVVVPRLGLGQTKVTGQP